RSLAKMMSSVASAMAFASRPGWSKSPPAPPSPRSGPGLLNSFQPRRDQLQQHVHVHRLDQVPVEAGLARQLLVLRLPPAGDGDQGAGGAARLRADTLAGLVTVHAGHAD